MTALRGDQALALLLQFDDARTILDIGSGTGEHTQAMRDAGREVTAISLIEPADYLGDFISWPSEKTDFDAIWACHVLEHQVDPGAFLRECRRRLRPDGYLAVTVPPLKHAIVGGHVTLWNAGLLLYQLVLAGFDCREARVGTYGYNISVIVQNRPADLPADLTCDHGDIDKLAKWFPVNVRQGFDGRMPNIRWADEAAKSPRLELVTPASPGKVPEHVVILGLGPSLEAYVDMIKRNGSRKAFADEVWGINAVGDVIQCDRVFHLDDVRIQEKRAEAMPNSNIAHMLTWLKTHPGPVYTSRPHPDYPGLVAYPLEEVINACQVTYFNSTAAFAVAFAIYLGVKKISIWGFDFTYANSHKAEQGRACVEFWLGVAFARGIELGIADRSSLMDHCEPEERRLYGYDTMHVDIDDTDGSAKVTFTERETVASAAEIEARYDHSKHPSPILRQIAAE